MTDEAKALVERLDTAKAHLLNRADLGDMGRKPSPKDTLRIIAATAQDAADLITRQAAQIERMREALGNICRDSNPDWTEKRVYPNDVLDEIHTEAVEAYYRKEHV